jgi:hypothetical protein
LKTRSSTGAPQQLPTSYAQGVEAIVCATPSPKAAEEKLLSMLAGAPIASGVKKPDAPLDLKLVELPSKLAQAADTEAEIATRKLHQTLRTLRRAAEGGSSETAVRVLSNDALRRLLEAAAWRKLAELGAQLDGGGPKILTAQPEADARALYAALTKTGDPQRFVKLAEVALGASSTAHGAAASKAGAAKRNGKAEPLSAHEKAALVDILQSDEPSRSALVKERLRRGDTSGVRDMLLERLLPTSLDAPVETSEPEAGGAAMNGLVFDLGINQWVSKDKSWKYGMRLSQLFDYEVKGIVQGKEELAARLEALATDPVTGEVSPPQAEIRAFVAELVKASKAHDPAIDALLGHELEFVFSTTDGGDKPVAALWELPDKAIAGLFDAMTQPPLRARVAELATAQDAKDAERAAEVRAKLGDLLDKYKGVPVRHKRQHAALINMGLAGQSVEELGRDTGALPKSKTTLSPESLTAQWGDAQHVKVRFLFTDHFDCHVVSDAMFQQVVDEYHFPPNHELLSYNRPIAGSGYLVLHQGKVVGIEDDTIMLPGKLPDGLPPAIEVFRRLGFELDEKEIAASSLVLDWEAFAKAGKAGALPPAPQGDKKTIRDAVAQASHTDRPALVASIVKQALTDARKPGLSEDAARAKAAEQAAELLSDLRIINVGAKVFRAGELPPDKSEFDDLIVDASLASFLVRKVAS